MLPSFKSSFVFGLAAVVAGALFAETAFAQDLHPSRRPSPMAMARTMVGDAYVSVVYSRPYKRDRDNIFGAKDADALITYGEVWRTGANEATQITVTDDVKVGGQTLPAGTYTVFSTPGEKEWQFHFNTKLGMWGTYAPGPDGKFGPAYEADLNKVSVTTTAGSTEEEVDQLTLAFEDSDDGKHLVLQWINTEVRLPFTAN